MDFTGRKKMRKKREKKEGKGEKKENGKEPRIFCNRIINIWNTLTSSA